MPLQRKAVPLSDSDEEPSGAEDTIVEKRIKLIRELSELEKPADKFSGGIFISTEFESNINSASANSNEKKGSKEVEELERELDLKNTFSKETNRRDEDAEMNKYIDEQIRIRREQAKRKQETQRKKDDDRTASQHNKESDLSDIFSSPATASDRIEDILLHSLSRNFASASDEKSEAMLSSQMLTGIPEVDLGIQEKIRTIEATEEARLRLHSKPKHQSTNKQHSTVPINVSTNYQHHRSSRSKTHGHSSRDSRDTHSGRSASSNYRNDQKTVTETVVSVGEEPREIKCRVSSSHGDRLPPRGRASDDYYLQKFKKNSRR